MRFRIFLLVFLALFGFALSAQIEYYGIQRVGDPNAVNKLKLRFKGSGDPLFLIKDAKSGVGIGDLIRFSDRAVLVDANVMQSLAQDGVLRALAGSQVVKLKATAKSNVWKSRASASRGVDKNGYLFGQELLKILENNLGGIPKREHLVLEFEGSLLSLSAPASLLNQLKSTQIRKDPPKPIQKPLPKIIKPKPKKGVPQFVSPPPLPLRLGQSLDWQAWAVDSDFPSDSLKYRLLSTLPVGIEWDSLAHRLIGQASYAGETVITLEAQNPIKKTDTLQFALTIQADSTPRILTDTLPIAYKQNKEWQANLNTFDFDDKLSELKWTLLDSTLGMRLDSTNRLYWTIPDSIPEGPYSVAIKISDPWGAESTKELQLSVLSQMEKMSTSAVELTMPRDTFIQNHCASWTPKWISMGNTKLIGIRTDDQTQWNAGVVKYCPRTPGEDSITYYFEVDFKPLSIVKKVYILPNQAPQWKHFTLPELIEQQEFQIEPMTFDPEGDSIQFNIMSSDTSLFRWDGERLYFKGASKGSYGIEMQADDGHGGISSQRIQIWVKANKKDIHRLNFSYTDFSDQQWWDLNYQRSGARFGFFSTDLDEHIWWQSQTDTLTKKLKTVSKAPEEVFLPYIYTGASLLGSEQSAKGNFLFTDIGFTLRPISNSIAGGGIFFRIQGNWQDQDQTNRSSFEWTLGLKQSLVLILDPRIYKVQQELNQCVDNTNVQCINSVLTRYQNMFPGCQNFDLNNEKCIDAITTFGLGNGIDRIMKSSTSKWNLVNFIRFSFERRIWDLPAKAGTLWVGPTAWRRDILMAPWFEQFMGAGAHWSGNYGVLHWDTGLNLGYGLAHREWTVEEKEDPKSLYAQIVNKPNLQAGQDWRYRSFSGMRAIFDLKLSLGN